MRTYFWIFDSRSLSTTLLSHQYVFWVLTQRQHCILLLLWLLCWVVNVALCPARLCIISKTYSNTTLSTEILYMSTNTQFQTHTLLRKKYFEFFSSTKHNEHSSNLETGKSNSENRNDFQKTLKKKILMINYDRISVRRNRFRHSKTTYYVCTGLWVSGGESGRRRREVRSFFFSCDLCLDGWNRKLYFSSAWFLNRLSTWNVWRTWK